MRSRLPRLTPQRWIILILLAFFALPAAAQNTKGDKPAVNNERQIRQTKAKTVRRKDKAKTRDIAGRRLRTKDKSSANRANAGIRQPNPYAGRPRVATDRAAKPRGRVYSEKPTEKPRVSRGDIAGHRIRTTKPGNADAPPHNVYPQQYSPQVARTQQPKRPPHYKSAASGRPVVRRVPAAQERAWKGDLRGQPVAPPRSVSAQRQNTFPNKNQYTRYVKKRVPADRAESNKEELSRTQRLSRKPHTSGGGGGYVTSGNKPYVKRGRKNVYWGKFTKKGERPVTTDIAGRPVRTRNYHSTPAGLVGRDTLMHFGKKPQGERSFAGGRSELPGPRTSNQGRSWRGDVSGHRLRGQRTPGDRASIQQYPGFLSMSRSGQIGKPIRNAPVTQSRRTGVAGRPLPKRSAGIVELTIAEDMRRTRGGKDRKRGGADVGSFSGNMLSTKRFQNQGEGFSGYTKTRKPLKGGGSLSGNLWNNNGTAIARRSLPRGSDRPGAFSGNMLSTKSFQNQGKGFAGYTKTRKPLKGGGSISGNLWNNNGQSVTNRTLPRSADKPGRFSGNMLSTKSFQPQGEGFSGYIKAQKPLKGGGSISGNPRNNNGQSVTTRTLPRGADKPGRFAGNMLSTKSFQPQGEGFSGYIKAQKPLKGGGSISGNPRNNNGQSVTTRTLPRGADKPGRFSGDMLSTKGFQPQGEDFTGYIKAKKPMKGGGSVSGKLWNNEEKPVTELPERSASISASRFEGKLKAEDKKPSTSGFDGEGKYTVKASGKVSKGEFDSEGKFRFKEDYTQSPRAVDESTKKHKPERAGFEADGLQIRVAKKDMSSREHSAPGALPGEGPKRGSVRASEYASGAKLSDRRHNPYAADEALKGTYYGGKTNANLGAFHGNIKARKFQSDRRFHPDSKFAHGPDNNVEDERTFFTNVKLWWTNLFHDSKSQPASVREKERRPRYDKGEKGMWAE